MGEAGEVFLVPWGREEGWGRQGKGCRDHRAGRRVGRGRGSVPGTMGPRGGVGRQGNGCRDQGVGRRGGGGLGKCSRYQGAGRRGGEAGEWNWEGHP